MVNYLLLNIAVKLVISAFFLFNFTIILQLIKHERECYKGTEEDKRSSLIFLESMIILILVIIWFDLNITSEMSSEGLTALLVMFFGFPAVLLLILIIYHTIMGVILKKPKLRRFGNEFCLRDDADAKKERIKFDAIRKITHIALFIGILLIIEISKHFIGSRPLEIIFGNPDGSTVVLNLFTSKPFLNTQAFIIMLFYALSTLFLIFDTTRLSTKVHFIMNKTIQRSMRKEELDTIAGYVYMPIGYLIVSFCCPETIIIGIFCLSAFADSAAAIYGIRFGKHKIKINPKKSWEGALAGFLTAAISSALFVGPIWGILAGLLFMVLDILSNKIRINDNILVPISTLLLFFILNLLNISAQCLFPITPFV